MSNSLQRFGNKKPGDGKAPERSNFAHTCNLLSQYVKEKGGLRDLNLAGIGGKQEATPLPATANSDATVTTMNLLNNIENLGYSSTQPVKPGDPFSQSVDLASKSNSNKEEVVVEPKRAQMTIFYRGEVMVFDDFPAEKAREIVLLASNGSCDSDFTASRAPDNLYCGDALPSSSTAPLNSVSAPAEQALQEQPDVNTSDMPIARRSSLHRFLAKRKDRAIVRGPYHQHQVQNAPGSSSSKNEEQLELKL